MSEPITPMPLTQQKESVFAIFNGFEIQGQGLGNGVFAKTSPVTLFQRKGDIHLIQKPKKSSCFLDNAVHQALNLIAVLSVSKVPGK
jgi:hypothetical protein